MEEPKTEAPARRVNGRMWLPGESGNANGRPIGARGRFSQRFVADLSDAWEEHGATALARTAQEYPDRFVGICSHLIPKDVSVSLTATVLPSGLDHDDWSAIVGVARAVKQQLNLKDLKPEYVADHVSRALAAYDATPIIDYSDNRAYPR
jgi:hypothetical protein